jgi:beta-galactosidase
MPPVREMQSVRINHCYTWPVYRQKCVALHTQLAKRYANHPALALWHVSNEYSGSCQCPLCFAAFQKWLQKKYTTLDAMNRAWWTAFWNHTFTAWDEIKSVVCESMRLDWRRFCTEQIVDFFLAESAPLREHTPGVPVCINTTGFVEGIDYWRFAPHLDVATYDSYPFFHDRPDPEGPAARAALEYDLARSYKNKPFLLMESAPGVVNWMPTNRLLRPGVHRLKSLQAVAHGSDSVQYFQIRKGLGGYEKFYGGVIDHAGPELSAETRMFKEVAQVGADLKALAPVVGAATPAKVAVVYDWESSWALEQSCGPSAHAKKYVEHCAMHHRAFWKRGVGVDVASADCDLGRYDVVVAPSLFMVRGGFAERLEKFVADGGVFVATWLTGVVDETGLVHMGGLPGTLRKVMGIWVEEVDYIYDDEANTAVFAEDNLSGLCGGFAVKEVCEVLHAQGADVVATYQRDFYAGKPCVTVNRLGKGEAWHIATDGGFALLDAFYGKLIARKKLPRALEADQPAGVVAQTRENENGVFTFVSNFTNAPAEARLGPAPRVDILSGKTVSGTVQLPAYGVMVLT